MSLMAVNQGGDPSSHGVGFRSFVAGATQEPSRPCDGEGKNRSIGVPEMSLIESFWGAGSSA